MSEELNMNEENRKQNTLPQLSDAALEGVSGGDDYEFKADTICRGCPRYRNSSCSHSCEGLARYLREKGTLIGSHYKCPFYNE